MSDQFNPYEAPRTVQTVAPLPNPKGQQFAPCYQCGNTWAEKVGYTWWGGVIGPLIISCVKCCQCGTHYNGKTGQSNTTKIAIYVAVTAVIGVVIGILAIST